MYDLKNNPLDPKTLKTNDIVTVIYYTTVKTTHPDTAEWYVENIDEPGKIIRIQGKELIEKAFSADYFAEEIKVSKLQAAEILTQSANKPFTVNFIKSDGQERTLRGRLLRPESLLGRSMVEDLDEPGPIKLRQVDHRTIQFIIVNGTKYTVK